MPTSLQPLLYRLPVDHIPDGREVFCLAVLVLQVIGMLPGINTQKWRVLADHRVLVGIRPDLDLASFVVLDEPCPSAPLDACQRSIELGLEGRKVAIGCLDCGLSYIISQRKFLIQNVQQRQTLTFPVGSPPPPFLLGARFSQKRVWLTCPPPWKFIRGCNAI